MCILEYELYYPYFFPCIFSILACGSPLPQQQLHHKVVMTQLLHAALKGNFNDLQKWWHHCVGREEASF